MIKEEKRKFVIKKPESILKLQERFEVSDGNIRQNGEWFAVNIGGWKDARRAVSLIAGDIHSLDFDNPVTNIGFLKHGGYMNVGNIVGEYLYDHRYCYTKDNELFSVMKGTLSDNHGNVIFSLQDDVYLVVRAATLKPKHTPLL